MENLNKVLAYICFLFVLIASTKSWPNDDYALRPGETREEMMIRYRLSNNTIPRLYKIKIEPDMESYNLTWNGETTIDIEIFEPTTILTLHAYRNLLIDENSTVLVDFDNTTYLPIEQIRDPETEFIKVKFDHEILIGNYSLSLKFRGSNFQSKVGFYDAAIDPPADCNSGSNEVNKENMCHKLKVAGTHFEATTARRAFPCFDEPSFKAHFRVSIVHYPNYTAVSNMPEIERIPTDNGKILTIFDTTPKMPTYLLNLIIAEYDNVSNEHGNVTIYARKDFLELVKYVNDMSTKVVEVMEEYTGFPFGFPRIGSVLLPSYSAAATEHWGLVTYKEPYVKFDQSMDSYVQEDLANLLIAHELAHSWFGNRVSPVWWDDLWLNEAFAAYFQYFIMDQIYDNWGGDQLFILINNQGMAFNVDHELTIPIRWTPITNTEIRNVFGPVTYRKGSAIVHMFRNVLSDNVFRTGIQKYLGKHSFGAATADDLMEAFQEAYNESSYSETPLNVKETMSTWLLQNGYPIVNVKRNYTSGITTVYQEYVHGNNSVHKWWIPLNYATQSNNNFSSTRPMIWMNSNGDNVTISDIDNNDWVIFNLRAFGYYRVNYDFENWKKIVDYLNTDNYTNIHVLNRAQIIDDFSFLSTTDDDRYSKLMTQLISYLSREVEYAPWRAAKDARMLYGDLIVGTEMHQTFQKYVFGLMNRLIEKIGFEQRDNDDHLTILSRGDIVGWACISGHQGCSEFAVEKLLKVMENGTHHKLHPNTKFAIACAGLRGLNDTNAKRFAEWALHTDRMLLIKNLGCTENHEIQRNFLINAMTKNSVESGDEFLAAFNLISWGSEENFNFAVDFILQNHANLRNLKKSTSWETPVYEIVHQLSSGVKTSSRLEKFKQILELDIVKEDKDLKLDRLTQQLEEGLSQKNAQIVKFNDQWHEQLASVNTIENSKSE